MPALGGPKRAATPGGELAAFGAALSALHCAGAAIEWREHLGLVAPTVADRRSIVSPAPRRVRLPPTALLGEWHWFDARALEAAKIADAAERARTERAAAATKGRAFEVRWIEAPDTADSSVVAAASPAPALVLVAAADADARAGDALWLSHAKAGEPPCRRAASMNVPRPQKVTAYVQAPLVTPMSAKRACVGGAGEAGDWGVAGRRSSWNSRNLALVVPVRGTETRPLALR